MTTEKPCPHILLKRQNANRDNPYYKCSACGQKFLAEAWDGKMVVEVKS